MLPVATILLVFILMEGAATDDSLDEYRRMFGEVSTVTWSPPTDGASARMYCIIADPAAEGSFLAGVTHSVAQLDTQSPSASLLLGNILNDGYTEGVGTDARFWTINSMVHVKSREAIILNDYKNSCLREFNRNELFTSAFAGQCTVGGDEDGHRLQAKLNKVHAIDYDENTNTLWLTERDTRKIKTISLATELVTTVADLSPQVAKIYGFRRPLSSPDNMLVIADNTLEENSTSGFSSYISGVADSKRLIELRPSLYLMTVYIPPDDGLLLQLVDTQRDQISTVCQKSEFDPASDILNCPEKPGTYDALASNGQVYFLGSSSEWVMTVIELNCSEMSWTEWGPCNVSTGLGVQSRYRHSCEVEKRVCWKSTQDVFIHLRGQCTIGEKITPATRRLDCAAVCLNDEQCQGFIMDSVSQECSTATVTGGGNYDCYLKRWTEN